MLSPEKYPKPSAQSQTPDNTAQYLRNNLRFHVAERCHGSFEGCYKGQLKAPVHACTWGFPRSAHGWRTRIDMPLDAGRLDAGKCRPRFPHADRKHDSPPQALRPRADPLFTPIRALSRRTCDPGANISAAKVPPESRARERVFPCKFHFQSLKLGDN